MEDKIMNLKINEVLFINKDLDVRIIKIDNEFTYERIRKNNVGIFKNTHPSASIWNIKTWKKEKSAKINLIKDLKEWNKLGEGQ